MSKSEQEFYTMRDIAALFRVSLSHVKQHLRWELPEPVKIGKRGLRWHRDAIQVYIKNNS